VTEGPWTLDELVAEAAVRLAGEGPTPARTRDVPDKRTVRYYTSLGLVAGPREFRGKVGLYGELQLLQLLAIKHLQAQGEPLDAIQARLLGLSLRRLRAIAQRDHAPASDPDESPPPPPPAVLQGVAVTAQLTLMVKARRGVMPEDVEAIEVASAPLVRLLRARRLID
jgi:DNA-binding transcriptional MerR regulator